MKVNVTITCASDNLADNCLSVRLCRPYKLFLLDMQSSKLLRSTSVDGLLMKAIIYGYRLKDEFTNFNMAQTGRSVQALFNKYQVLITTEDDFKKSSDAFCNKSKF